MGDESEDGNLSDNNDYHKIPERETDTITHSDDEHFPVIH